MTRAAVVQMRQQHEIRCVVTEIGHPDSEDIRPPDEGCLAIDPQRQALAASNIAPPFGCAVQRSVREVAMFSWLMRLFTTIEGRGSRQGRRRSDYPSKLHGIEHFKRDIPFTAETEERPATTLQEARHG